MYRKVRNCLLSVCADTLVRKSSWRTAIVTVVALLLSSVFVACNENGEPPVPEKEHSLLMYFPWSDNLTSYFEVNISDMEKAYLESGKAAEQDIVVFFATSASEAEMYRLVISNGRVVRQPLQSYAGINCTTAEGIAGILADFKAFSPARSYAMTIGCHGMGWLPAGTTGRAAALRGSDGMVLRYHWEYDVPYPTRFFGGTTSGTQADVTSLAEGIKQAGLHMDYILFDDCYMSTVEVAYDLKDVAHYLVCSPTEMMAFGMPYSEIGGYLLGKPDFEALCNGFLAFYSQYSMPSGTLAVTDCSEVEALAGIMQKINGRFMFDSSLESDIQPMDGYSPGIFFDLGSYVKLLCSDADLLRQFDEQLAATVIYRVHTQSYYSSVNRVLTPINEYSGLTVSDPSRHVWTQAKTKTAWYRATH